MIFFTKRNQPHLLHLKPRCPYSKRAFLQQDWSYEAMERWRWHDGAMAITRWSIALSSSCHRSIVSSLHRHRPIASSSSIHRFISLSPLLHCFIVFRSMVLWSDIIDLALSGFHIIALFLKQGDGAMAMAMESSIAIAPSFHRSIALLKK